MKERRNSKAYMSGYVDPDVVHYCMSFVSAMTEALINASIMPSDVAEQELHHFDSINQGYLAVIGDIRDKNPHVATQIERTVSPLYQQRRGMNVQDLTETFFNSV